MVLTEKNIIFDPYYDLMPFSPWIILFYLENVHLQTQNEWENYIFRKWLYTKLISDLKIVSIYLIFFSLYELDAHKIIQIKDTVVKYLLEPCP